MGIKSTPNDSVIDWNVGVDWDESRVHAVGRGNRPEEKGISNRPFQEDLFTHSQKQKLGSPPQKTYGTAQKVFTYFIRRTKNKKNSIFKINVTTVPVE